MKSRIAISIIVAVIIAFGAGYWFATPKQLTIQKQLSISKQHPISKQETEKKSAERVVLYWYDPMQPHQHFDKPGKSPFMDMELVPRYADKNAADKSAGIVIDQRAAQNLGLRFASVERASINDDIVAVGTVAFNEREVTVLQARASGFVQRVYAHAPNDIIKRGAPIVDLLIPEWLGAQHELLALKTSGDANLLQAARERANAIGMSSALIATIERDNKPRTAITIVAEQNGVLRTLDVRAGMAVTAGATLATINAIDRVWLEIAVPETLAQRIKIGDILQAHFAASSATAVDGKVIAIVPENDAATRTVRVRAQLPNASGQLRPGQFAQVQFTTSGAPSSLWIPAEALIRGADGNRVIAADATNHLVPLSVQIGRAAQNKIEILSGLSEGQKIIASGQFLIDSEANLNGELNRMQGATNTSSGVSP